MGGNKWSDGVEVRPPLPSVRQSSRLKLTAAERSSLRSVTSAAAAVSVGFKKRDAERRFAARAARNHMTLVLVRGPHLPLPYVPSSLSSIRCPPARVPDGKYFSLQKGSKNVTPSRRTSVGSDDPARNRHEFGRVCDRAVSIVRGGATVFLSGGNYLNDVHKTLFKIGMLLSKQPPISIRPFSGLGPPLKCGYPMSCPCAQILSLRRTGRGGLRRRGMWKRAILLLLYQSGAAISAAAASITCLSACLTDDEVLGNVLLAPLSIVASLLSPPRRCLCK